MKRILVGVCLILSTAFSAFSQGRDIRIVDNINLNNHSFISFKTNFLYDAVLVPNIGVELNLYKNLTVYGDIMYADWNLPSRHTYWNLYGTQAGIRKYFGKAASERSFTGHHAGIYCQALAYDLQVGFIGQQTPSINIGAGLEYGYSFPVALGFNIDVELGIGYLTGKYYEYDVKDDHYAWRGTIHRNWFGPTKASVSLVWIIKSNRQINRNEQ